MSNKTDLMNANDALMEVGKYAPCPHDCIDTNLGNGLVWARCDDCGETFRQESLDRLRQSHERFMQALQVIQDSFVQPAATEKTSHPAGVGRRSIATDCYILGVPGAPGASLSEVLPFLEYMADIVKEWDVAYWFPDKMQMTAALLRVYKKYLKERYPQTHDILRWSEYQDLIEICGPLNPRKPTDCSHALLDKVKEFVDGLIEQVGIERAKTMKIESFHDPNKKLPFHGWYGGLEDNKEWVATTAVSLDFGKIDAEEVGKFSSEVQKYFCSAINVC